MDRLVRLQAASNYTGLGSRSAGERYVVVYLAPGAAGHEAAEATLQLNDERKAVPAEFAEGLAGLLEKSGLYGADGLTEWNPELPPTIGFHALACEFESGRIFKTSASGFSEVWAAFAAPFMELVQAQFGRPVPAPEEAGETREPAEETPAEPVPETAAAAEPVQPIDLGPVADEPAEELTESETPSDEPAGCEPAAEEPVPEYAVGSEEEEWAPEYEDLNSEIKTADAELSLMDAELDSASAKLDYAEARLEDIETALDAAQAALIDAEAELDMYRDGFAEPPAIDPKHIDEI
ncbi:MAG: hypothetical protein IKG59_00475 [Firmicutes bacterium]|nr:hypothetical protein [Bacillota bacterium]